MIESKVHKMSPQALDALITREEVVVEAEDGREVSGYDLLAKLHPVNISE